MDKTERTRRQQHTKKTQSRPVKLTNNAATLTEKSCREAIFLGVELSHFRRKLVVIVDDAVAQSISEECAVKLTWGLPQRRYDRRLVLHDRQP